MKLLNEHDANGIREKYVSCFVDTDSEYYLNRIQKLTRFKDGMCYTGYLWDCLKNRFIMSEEQCLKKMECQDDILVFWDIHSSERILIPNYWKYPKCAVLQMNYQEFLEIRDNLPEDIYVVDKTFLWSVVFTHEEAVNQTRFCYFAYS